MAGLQGSATSRYLRLWPVRPSLLAWLQHLDLSGNPELTGTLPGMWGRIRRLRILDVSGCGGRGRLPQSWASLQQLTEFKASYNHSGWSGQLPDHWGMLTNLVVLEIDKANLTGLIPEVWAGL